MKAHPEPSTLYVQVGDSKRDNDYFGNVITLNVKVMNLTCRIIGPDINIPEPRPSYKITDENFGTDVAAIACKCPLTTRSVYMI